MSTEQNTSNWPTPQVSDGEGGRKPVTEFTGVTFRSYNAKSNQHFGAKLRDAVEMDQPVDKVLNPDWVEQLMGLPVGTTKLRGVPLGHQRIDRIRMLGNGVVPAQAALAFYILGKRLAKEEDDGR